VTSTVRDRHATSVVAELVPRGMVPEGTRLYPVGRLDRESEGLLLLTNDGAWAEHVLHPRYGVEREYAVLVDGPLGGEALRQLRAGIDLDEGLATAAIELLPRADLGRLLALLPPEEGGARGGTWYRVLLTQGFRRQVRRMFAAAGVPVRRLARTRIGPVDLAPLRSGEVRRLSDAEVELLGRVSSMR
jgi:23S rRNA pseudouridine2605 synthase